MFTAKRTDLKWVVIDKMQVLKDFGIVDEQNYAEYEEMLYAAVREHPDSDPRSVLDRFVRPIIMKKLNR